MENQSIWKISRICHIDYKTAKKYVSMYKPEVEKAQKKFENLKIDENQSFLKRIPILDFLRRDDGPAKQAE